MAENRNCQNCQQTFTVEPEDFEFYEKMQVPAPTWCPMCRARRRLAWRNERSLYKRKCDKTGKDIFSMYHQEAPVTVVDNDYWWGDSWDGTEYAQEIDWNRSLLEQFKELSAAVPRTARSVIHLENSDYSNNAGSLKDCYLVFNGLNSERVMYGVGIGDSRDSVDNNYLFSSELCYGCVMCRNCYNCRYCIDCENSNDLFFCKNLINSSHCIASVNLRNAKFCIFNQQYSEAEYQQRMKEMQLDTVGGVERLQKEFLEFMNTFPVKYIHETNTENFTGEYLYNSKNVYQCYFVNAENAKYCQFVLAPQVKDCYDYSFWGENVELMYESIVCGMNLSRIQFCYDIYPNCTEIEYSMFCTSSSNIFLCAGLKKKQYCILNKQYTKEEYEALLPKLKQQMIDMPYTDAQGRVYKYGEFFPPEFLPYGYNETLAYELFPLTKEEAAAAGYEWREPDARNYAVSIAAKDLPQNIHDASDDILKQIIGCEHAGACAHNCTTAFKILPQELAFYRTHGIPLPRFCPTCRHHARIVWRNPMQLHERQCQCAGTKSENGVYINSAEHDHDTEHCSRNFQTTYATDRKEIIYCKECYNSEVI